MAVFKESRRLNSDCRVCSADNHWWQYILTSDGTDVSLRNFSGNFFGKSLPIFLNEGFQEEWSVLMIFTAVLAPQSQCTEWRPLWERLVLLCSGDCALDFCHKVCRSTWSLYVPPRRRRVSMICFFGLWTRIFNFSFNFFCFVYSMKVYESCLPGSRKYDGQVSLVLIRLLASTTSFSGSTCYDLLFLFLPSSEKYFSAM